MSEDTHQDSWYPYILPYLRLCGSWDSIVSFLSASLCCQPVSLGWSSLPLGLSPLLHKVNDHATWIFWLSLARQAFFAACWTMIGIPGLTAGLLLPSPPLILLIILYYLHSGVDWLRAEFSHSSVHSTLPFLRGGYRFPQSSILLFLFISDPTLVPFHSSFSTQMPFINLIKWTCILKKHDGVCHHVYSNEFPFLWFVGAHSRSTWSQTIPHTLYASLKCSQETEPEVALLGHGIHVFYCIRAAIVDLSIASFTHTSESKSSRLLIY